MPDNIPFQLEIPETGPNRIITWDDVRKAKDMKTLKLYYLQRLGPGFTQAPVVNMSPETFESLIFGDGDIYSRMLNDDPEAAWEVWFAYTMDRNRSIAMGMNIESATVGARIISYITSSIARDTKQEKNCDAHREWLRHTMMLANECRQLFWRWKRGKVKYHRLNLPEPCKSAMDPGDAPV